MVSCIGPGPMRFVVRQMVDRAVLGALVFGQHFSRAVDDIDGQSRQLRDLDAVALVGRALLHFAQKDNSAAAFLHRHVKVLHAAQPVGQLGQLVIMRGKQRLGARVGVNVFDGRPGDGQPIIGRSAAARPRRAE